MGRADPVIVEPILVPYVVVFKLYTTLFSANGRKPLAVSSYLGLEPEIEFVDVYRGDGRSADYLAINPFGKIPTLVDGDLTLWESNAILQYVSEAYGEYRLWSREPRQRADISRWLFWESCHWQPAFVPVLTEHVSHLLQTRTLDSDPPAVQWQDDKLQSVLRFVDDHLEGREYLVGDELALADFSLAGMMMYLRPASFPWDAFPNLAEWYARIESLEAWRATAVEPWHY